MGVQLLPTVTKDCINDIDTDNTIPKHLSIYNGAVTVLCIKSVTVKSFEWYTEWEAGYIVSLEKNYTIKIVPILKKLTSQWSWFIFILMVVKINEHHTKNMLCSQQKISLDIVVDYL